MFHTKNNQQNLLHRLKIARGHLDKVMTMIEEDAYCMDILHQTNAVKSALTKIDEILLENHLSHCIVDHIKEGREKQAIEEVMKVFHKK